jgi:site-specific DNA-adenine methylase
MTISSPPTLIPPLKWHGGKHYLATRIVERMPPHLHYVEPFAGGLAVLLAKDPEGVSEVVNDLHGDLTNFFRVVQEEETFARFRGVLEAVPFSEVEWQDAGTHLAGRPEAETSTARDVYGPLEMSTADHREFLDTIRAAQGKVLVSGYPSELYDTALSAWSRHSFDLPNQAAGGKSKRRMTEVVWCNF